MKLTLLKVSSTVNQNLKCSPKFKFLFDELLTFFILSEVQNDKQAMKHFNNVRQYLYHFTKPNNKTTLEKLRTTT